ncbi:MAG: YafY family transcriptional regulator [Bacteroidetes bacterium]|nr:YafY family transcriptional regulator [Bacteroidota bacterium]
MPVRPDRSLHKTERLFALVLLLQNKPNMTSKDLAEHFGVSRRTIFRDLRSLTDTGVPLTYADGGGYEILEGYHLPPLMLTAREAATVLIGTAFTKLQPDPSLRRDANEVRLKLRSVLPDTIREYIDRLHERTVLSPYNEVQVQRQSNSEEEGLWFELSEAVARQQRVKMTYYTPSRDEETARIVDPLGLVYYTDHWNLIAFDHLRDEVRNFRLDRIRKLRTRLETFEPPEGFDLKEHLRGRGENPENVRMVVRFHNRAWRWAKRSLPADIELEKETKGATEVTFRFENPDYVARWLLRFGSDVKVLEPTALKKAHKELAANVAKQYS